MKKRVVMQSVVDRWRCRKAGAHEGGCYFTIQAP